MQTDVKSTKPLTTTGAFKDQNDGDVSRARIKAIYAICGASAGTVVITNGSGGETLFYLDTPAVSTCGYVYIILPGEGIVASTGLYGTITQTASISIFYG